MVVHVWWRARVVAVVHGMFSYYNPKSPARGLLASGQGSGTVSDGVSDGVGDGVSSTNFLTHSVAHSITHSITHVNQQAHIS